MSATPDNQAGQWTEEVMAAFLRRLAQRRLPRPETPIYNAAYEAVYEVLERRLPKEEKHGR